MWRKAHRWAGLGLGLLLTFLAATGAILSVDPLLRRIEAGAVASRDLSVGGLSVGELLRRAAKANPHFEIDRVRVDYTGRVLLRGADAGGAREVPVNLKTGRLARKDKPRPVMELVTRLHRNLALGPSGRPVTLAGAAAMTALMLSGLWLLQRRLGGWRRLVGPVRGRGWDGWHTRIGRLALLPLTVTVVTGLWMGLVSNGLAPSGVGQGGAKPDTRVEAAPVPATDLAAFDAIPLSGLTELSFPIAADWWDVYTLRQGGRLSYLDRQSGAVLAEGSVPLATRALDLVRLLHTGQGASLWGVIAGLVSLTVPFFVLSGTLVWLRRRHPRPRGLVRVGAADVVIAVGSETGTTWGFAAHLAGRLRDRGLAVALTPMNATLTMRAEATLLVLAATYGDGVAPSGADQFLTRLPGWRGAARFAVLGFGDTGFPAYCAFAARCRDALRATGRAEALPMGDVNRRSAQAFAAWGRDLGAALAAVYQAAHPAAAGQGALTLDYAPPRPRTRALELVAREDFPGIDAPAAILRFRAPEGRAARLARRLGRARLAARIGLPRHRAGDLLGVVPPGDPVARLYSLASSRGDGFVELCVARVEGGVCSTLLLGLAPGDRIDAYVQPNPAFRPARRRPTIMIGAGTGIAPFAGMIRRAHPRRAPALFLGLRHPARDFYYQRDLDAWQREGRLAAFHPAFSRGDAPAYVQDRVRAAAPRLAADLARGATVMVCGSTRMARAVAHDIDAIARGIGLTVADLRAAGRYLEDIY